MIQSKVVNQQNRDDRTLERYQKRRGTANLGISYEKKMVIMVLGKLHDDPETSFYLGSNIADIGVFDDIVVRSSVGGKTRKLFAQIKHKSPEYTVNFDDLVKPENTKNDFHLCNFFESYLNIRNKFSTASADVLFRGEFENTDVDLIIFTPAKIIFPEDARSRGTDSRDPFYTTSSGQTVQVSCTGTMLDYFKKDLQTRLKAAVAGKLITELKSRHGDEAKKSGWTTFKGKFKKNAG
uniref:(northern house mosquito) hypothetical protein n=1 Tax=Culex pipiens TaxID=7175 RepID=A0A8D8BW12_CULPI